MTAAGAPGIFICHRREDAAYPAGWLFDRLAARFGATAIFNDVESIRLGDDFAEQILTAVGSCAVLLVVIGRRWLTATGSVGRRLDDAADIVRLEIEAALIRSVRVIPVLVDGAQMPRANELPASLQALARRQAVELRSGSFGVDTDRLMAVL